MTEGRRLNRFGIRTTQTPHSFDKRTLKDCVRPASAAHAGGPSSQHVVFWTKPILE
jgi:hypothetical protein